jgi:hypothetical protein
MECLDWIAISYSPRRLPSPRLWSSLPSAPKLNSFNTAPVHYSLTHLLILPPSRHNKPQTKPK